MPWKLILELVGPGIHYNKPRRVFLEAIEEARRRKRDDAAEHIRIMLALRDKVMFDQPRKGSN